VSRWAAAAVLAVTALACSDPREAELAQELAALHEGRLPKASLERMKEEADAAEAETDALAPELDAVRGETEARKEAVAALEAAVQREIARNEALNAEIQERQQALQKEAEAQAALELEIAKQKARAQTFVDQAGVLTRELRPDDPDWAVKLRVRTLAEFLKEVGSAWPRDSVLGELGRRPLPGDAREATRVGAELAAQVRARVREVYGLEEAAGPGPDAEPSVAAEPPTS
jgi:DNA repair exonuclease SbcCD ATPase subunit